MMDGVDEAVEQMIRERERKRIVELLAPVFRELPRCDWCLMKHGYDASKHKDANVAVTKVYGEKAS